MELAALSHLSVVQEVLGGWGLVKDMHIFTIWLVCVLRSIKEAIMLACLQVFQRPSELCLGSTAKYLGGTKDHLMVNC